ncbi:Uncharacterised protein [Psychrobacter phenylpyruvicus]|uniref:Uncharacterized protein n=1 Tax=Psychrobacter phenylpyruvicus TaxID=29432 RepID=A0A379LPZ4_9GAMM|nr:Uncharacterised protein [Psychrobacter phenylpyruvicus]
MDFSVLLSVYINEKPLYLDEAPCVRIVVTPNNQVKGGNKEQRCPDTVKRENKLY